MTSNHIQNDIEFASPEEIRDFQDARLREAVAYLAANSPYYRRMFRDNGIDPASIRTVDDLQRLPFTAKKDLQLYNNDFLCVPKEKVIDYITTSGTLGDPVTFGCTELDLQRLAYNEKKSFSCAGVRPGDIIQLMTTLDKRFMAGLAYFLGIRELGASVIRVGNGIPELQWDTIHRIQPDTIMCVPSFILRLIDYAEKNGIDYRASSIRRIIGIGEGLRGQDVEIIGDDDKPVPDGEPGEVVVTTLGVEGMPLLRFRTGDISRKITGQCKCGRNSFRLTPIVGRKNNMIKLKGTTVYPPAIYDVLDNTPYVANYVVLVRDSFAGTDEVVVKVGLNSRPAFDVIKELKDRFRSRIRVAPIIEILDPDDVNKILFPSTSRKPLKFIDLRNHK